MLGVGTFEITPKAIEYVTNVLSSQRLSYGPYTQAFEARFAAMHDCRFGIMTNSGTSSLLIALAALKNRYGWKDGDEVIVPAVTFIATSNIVLQLNMKPVFVDVDPIYYELDPDRIEPAITPRTRCIIPVHLFGLPCDMGPILEIAERHGLRIIEDSCETMFTRLNGRSVGSFGDIGCFSTYMAHILTTGVGGLCTTNDPELAIALRSLMNHGRDSIYLNIDDAKNKSPEELQLIVDRRFSFIQMGYSFRVTEMEGALGLAQLEDHERIMTCRRENGRFFMGALKAYESELQLPTLRPGAGHAFMMLPLVRRKGGKQALVHLLESNGIETREMLPLTNQPFYRSLFGLKEEDYPVAKWINENGFYVACHQGLTAAEREYIVDIIGSFCEQRSVARDRTCLIMMTRKLLGASKPLIDAARDLRFDDYVLAAREAEGSLLDYYTSKDVKVILSENAGKGMLLKKAMSQTTAENIVIMGLDGCDDLKDATTLLIKLKQGAQLVMASRFLAGGGRLSERARFFRSVGNRFFSFLLSIFVNRNITDCNNIFRGIKKSAFSRLDLTEDGDCIMFEMTLKASALGLKYEECATVERPAQFEVNKRNRILTALGFCRVLLLYWVSPLRTILQPLGGKTAEVQ